MILEVKEERQLNALIIYYLAIVIYYYFFVYDVYFYCLIVTIEKAVKRNISSTYVYVQYHFCFLCVLVL